MIVLRIILRVAFSIKLDCSREEVEITITVSVNLKTITAEQSLPSKEAVYHNPLLGWGLRVANMGELILSQY